MELGGALSPEPRQHAGAGGVRRVADRGEDPVRSAAVRTLAGQRPGAHPSQEPRCRDGLTDVLSLAQAIRAQGGKHELG